MSGHIPIYCLSKALPFLSIASPCILWGGAALADAHVIEKWTCVYDEVSPMTNTHKSGRETEFFMHGKIIKFISDSGNKTADIGGSTNIPQRIHM